MACFCSATLAWNSTGVDTEGFSDFLFPGTRTGRAKTLGALNQNIKTVLTERVGIAASAHFFRHVAGKLILQNDPRAIRTVQEQLGHQDSRTLKFYVDSGGSAAAEYFDALIDDQRSQPSPRPAAFRKSARRAGLQKGRS